MYYNFHILLIISIIIGSPIIFLKRDILKELSVLEELIFTSFFIFLVSLIIYLLYENKSLEDLKKYLDSENKNKFILYVILLVITLIMGNYIIKNEKGVVRYRSFKSSLSFIMFLILGHYVFNENITKNIILGIMIIILGLYVIDNK